MEFSEMLTQRRKGAEKYESQQMTALNIPSIAIGAFAPLHDALPALSRILVWALVGICVSIVHAQQPGLRVVYDNDKRPIAIEASGWTNEDLAKFAQQEPTAIESLSKRLQICVLDDA